MKRLTSDTMCVLVHESHQSAVTTVSTFTGTLQECLSQKQHHLNRDCYWNDGEVLLGRKHRLGYTLKARNFFSKVRIIPAVK